MVADLCSVVIVVEEIQLRTKEYSTQSPSGKSDVWNSFDVVVDGTTTQYVSKCSHHRHPRLSDGAQLNLCCSLSERKA